MGKRSQIGVCRICGSNGPLSFEHVPPESAFNDRPIVRVIGRHSFEDLPTAKGPISQKGGGAYTLCPKCNNDTGGWYGSAYVGWAYQGVKLMEHAKRAPSLYHIFHIFPLRVIKQIICIFFSVNSANFHSKHEDLVRFVLNKDHKYLDPRLRVFVYFHATPAGYQSGVSGMAYRGGYHIFSQFAFPPFGYILSLDGKLPDDRLVDISFFSRNSYNEWKDVALRLPVFNKCTWVPGDFRSREEVITDMERYENP